ncbi:MAG: type II toxin-antitoxin system RelE/ParE family toxin [Bradyrhizobium sp.]|nr:type II toxin-antitoxin system RelE/ParE family toxin [Bradyrhizobium sp.]
MKVEYSNRATSDLRKVASDSRRIFGEKVAAELGRRIEEIVERIRRAPESAPKVDQRSGVRVVLLIRYPYKILYRVLPDRIRILHVRHTSRRPWRPTN